MGSPPGREPEGLLNLDRYIERESPVHQADARVKFLLTIAFILAVTTLPIGSFAALAIAWLLAAGVSLLAHIGPWRMIRGGFVALPFALAAFPLIFTRQGDPLGDLNFGLFTLTISGEGLRTFATILVKSWISVQAAALLTFTTPFHDLVDGLRQLRFPRLLIAVISLMYRYIAVIGDEAVRMMRARAARSAHPDGSGGGPPLWRLKVVGGMVGSLFLRSLERSERVYAAMLSRGFDGEFRHLHGRALVTRDWASLALPLMLFATFAISSRLWLPHS
ncbi:MAG: cobalt ECF transporter T component CbiQ [Dehalococcoidia bacterium]